MSEQDKNNKSTGSRPPEEGYGIFDLIWLSIGDIPRIMRTLKFAVWVILILSFFTLAGAILPQEEFASSPQEFADQYTALFNLDPGDSQLGFGEILYVTLVKPLQLYRIFETGHYFVLLMLLTISAALCAWDRLLITRKLAGLTKAKAGRESIKAQPYAIEGKTSVAPEDAEKRARDYLGSRGFKVFSESKGNETIWLFGRRNFFKHYASVIFHFAFVFILAGGIIGNERVLGYEGRFGLTEGEMSMLGEDRQAEILYTEKMRKDPPEPGEEVIPFTPSHEERIQLIEYENIYRERDFGEIDPRTGLPLDYYGTPSDFVSHLRIIKPGADGESYETLVEKAIEVNYPLKFGKVKYFQLKVNARLTFRVHLPGGETEEVATWLNQPFSIPGYDFAIHTVVMPMDIAGGFWEADDGTRTELPYVVRLQDYSADIRNPVLVGYMSQEHPLSVAGVTIELAEIREYTVLQYVHDPGVPLVYFGGLLLIFGLTYTLYFPYRTVRIILEARGKETGYVVGSNTSETPENLAKALENKD